MEFIQWHKVMPKYYTAANAVLTDACDSKMHIIMSLQFLIPLRTREKTRDFHVQKQPIYN